MHSLISDPTVRALSFSTRILRELSRMHFRRSSNRISRLRTLCQGSGGRKVTPGVSKLCNTVLQIIPRHYCRQRNMITQWGAKWNEICKLKIALHARGELDRISFAILCMPHISRCIFNTFNILHMHVLLVLQMFFVTYIRKIVSRILRVMQRVLCDIDHIVLSIISYVPY